MPKNDCIPDSIDLSNCFLSKKIKVPSEKTLSKDCFNLCNSLDEYILTRLIYYRDNCPSELISTFNFDVEPKQEIEKIIRGFWISVNIFENARTKEQQKAVKNARVLLVKYWDSLWH